MAMMVSFQKHLDRQGGGDRERQFFSRSLLHLTSATGHHVQLEDWMITSFDVELGPEIGEGGL